MYPFKFSSVQLIPVMCQRMLSLSKVQSLKTGNLQCQFHVRMFMTEWSGNKGGGKCCWVFRGLVGQIAFSFLAGFARLKFASSLPNVTSSVIKMSRRQHQQASAGESPIGSDTASDTDQPLDTGTYMTCVWNANQLGVAYLDQTTGHVRLLCGFLFLTQHKVYTAEFVQVNVLQTHDDATGPFAFQMLQLAKLQAAPSVIHTSSKSDKLFLDKLRDTVGGSNSAAQHQVQIEKASLFSMDHALRLMQNIHVRGTPATLSGTDRLHILNTHINLAATQQVSAAGALLASMHREGQLSSGPAVVACLLPCFWKACQNLALMAS